MGADMEKIAKMESEKKENDKNKEQENDNNDNDDEEMAKAMKMSMNEDENTDSKKEENNGNEDVAMSDKTSADAQDAKPENVRDQLKDAGLNDDELDLLEQIKKAKGITVSLKMDDFVGL